VTRYLSCRTCGTWVPLADAVSRAFCSEECTRAYTECITCGRIFLRGKGFDGEHCTRECSTRYMIFRKYGPEPVTDVTEV
jgi:hypothetical protein